MVELYVDLAGWDLMNEAEATNVCCECLKSPHGPWYVSDREGVMKSLCEECKDPKSHWRCCLCVECARKVGIVW